MEDQKGEAGQTPEQINRSYVIVPSDTESYVRAGHVHRVYEFFFGHERPDLDDHVQDEVALMAKPYDRERKLGQTVRVKSYDWGVELMRQPDFLAWMDEHSPGFVRLYSGDGEVFFVVASAAAAMHFKLRWC